MSTLRSMQFRDRLNNGLLALAVLLILLTSLISVRSTGALRESINQVQSTRDVKEAIEQFRRAFAESENYSLLYLIGGSPDHLRLYQQQSRAVETLLARVAELTQHDSAQQAERLTRLAKFHSMMLERTEKLLELKRNSMRYGSSPRWVNEIREGQRAIIVDGILAELADINAEEATILKARVGQRDAMLKQTNATVLTANSLALVAGLLGFLAIRRAQLESERALRTELKRVQASRASDEKSAFLANMSHEIRTPMNAIFGFAQLLSEAVTAPLQRQWVQAIKTSGQLLLSLINNVLDLSKIEAGKFELNAQPSDLRRLADETIELFATQAADKGIGLTVEVVEDAFSIVDVDAQRLRQVMMNLVSNAVKYTEQGSVRLQVSMVADQQLRNLRLRVIDTGVGIAEEQRNRIFEPFHQAESPDGKLRPGTGLGLSITRRLVELMDGRITVVSELGAGSTFLVEIPRLPVSELPIEQVPHDRAAVDFNRLPPMKILVVDDMVWNAQVAQGYLGRSHHRVFIAGDGVEGVAMAKQVRPDLVLMDLRMPRMNGYEARDLIRADPVLRDTVIVAVTASSVGSEHNALRQSFDGYIRKPYTPADLFSALEPLFGAKPRAPLRPPVPARPPLVAAPRALPQLAQVWRSLRGDHLAQVRSTMRMREISSYAQALRALGAELRWQRLIDHADQLDEAVGYFDVGTVKSLLNDLAQWPEELPDG